MVVLNVEKDDDTYGLMENEKLPDILKVLARDIGKAFKIRNPSDTNCHAAILNARETRPKEAYEKILNTEISATDT